jgi:probable HAF family extracellular repeat protein
VSAVSADGSVVAGFSVGSAGMEAFRFTDVGGIEGLGFLSMSNPDSEATGVSADGSVVSGSSHDGDGLRPFRWTSGGGLVQLGTFSCSSCDPATVGNGISGDGLVVVGSGLAKSLIGDPHVDAARWSGGGTSINNLGDLSGPAEFSVAHGASQTGSIIVGEGDSSSGNQGWWWSSGGGMQALVGIAGALVRSGAQAVSPDGSSVVGFANTNTSATTTLEAVRWTGGGFTVVELLGSLPGASSPSSNALAVNGDGSVIVGRARSGAGSDRAFIWDDATGMRELAVVLETEYGLDLTGWLLHDARGVSDVGLDGEFTVVGNATNPNGDPEAYVAFLVDPACRNGDDDDLDLATDYPADTGCTSAVDLSEVADCSDGIDNDGDGDTDFGADGDCTSAGDATELPDCGDGIDNDGDGQVDHPADPGCASLVGQIEDPACDDGIGNDLDLAIDHPADPECVAAFDLSEVADCNDGIDNDGDGDIDYPADSDCSGLGDASEAPECSDGIDNDGDGRTDHPAAYPRCVSATDAIEAPQCNDGDDNDLDLATDFPADTGCTGPNGDTESPPSFVAGDLLVVDRASRAVFSVEPSGGTQTLVSQGAWLGDPQGIATNGAGGPVVADPAGLVAIDPRSGAQRIASPPLAGGESLQVVFPISGDPFVLELGEISQVQWSSSGIGAKTTFLSVPTPGPIPALGVLAGDSLALESSGNLLTGGFSLLGDGVFRVDVGTQTAAMLKPGFANDIWTDLAVEDGGTILGVGSIVTGGVGLHRIDPSTGISTPLSVGSPFVTPVAVARDATGQIYVADAGTCSPTCVGGAIVHVDPGTGTPTVISTGGYVQGEMDLAIAVPEPGGVPMLVAGVALLLAIGRKRARW